MSGNVFTSGLHAAIFSADAENFFGFYYFMQKKGRKLLA